MVDPKRTRLSLTTSRALPMLLAAAVGVSMTISACSSSHADRGEGQREIPDRPEAIRDPVPPNHCRMVATVLDVHTPEPGLSNDDPCSKYPCMATVRVDSILGYGSGFTGSLGPGQTIEVRFAYTLAPSKEAYPAQAFSLSGLAAGDRFQADLSGGQEMMRSEEQRKQSRYGVTLYRVME